MLAKRSSHPRKKALHARARHPPAHPTQLAAVAPAPAAPLVRGGATPYRVAPATPPEARLMMARLGAPPEAPQDMEIQTTVCTNGPRVAAASILPEVFPPGVLPPPGSSDQVAVLAPPLPPIGDDDTGVLIPVAPPGPPAPPRPPFPPGTPPPGPPAPPGILLPPSPPPPPPGPPLPPGPPEQPLSPPTTGVPEPTTWVLMMVGFGAVGGALRHRRVAAQ